MKAPIKKLILSIFLSITFVFIFVILAMFISKQYAYKMKDVLSIEGLILLIIGVFSMMEGGPSFSSIRSVPQKDSPPDTYMDVETLVNEKKNEVRNHLNGESIIKLTFSGSTLIISAIFILLCSYFLEKLF